VNRLGLVAKAVLNTQDRRSIARMMMRCASGRVDGVFGSVSWEHDKKTKDLVYRVS
jgi:hypothetical protein